MEWKQLMSAERPGQKAGNVTDTRSAFEQDYDRIIFSHPFRRLQDKTQVHPLPEQDFVHTRLTHSLEVSSVGRSLGKRVGEVILQRHPSLASSFSVFDFGAVAAAASLAHDLGNPPFGHAGEDAISDFFKDHPQGRVFRQHVSPAQWEDLVRFEGNAQGFRILCRNGYGLRLTYATLGAFTKYPCAALLPERDKTRRSQKKFGFFQSEQEQFTLVAQHLGLRHLGSNTWCRHPLAFIVEAADDICYSIIDLEDGCRLGLVSWPETIELLAPFLGQRLDRKKLDDTPSLNEKLSILRAMAIGTLIDACMEVFADYEQSILDGSFDDALTALCVFAPDLREIVKISLERIYRARSVVEIEASGHSVIPGLLESFCRTGEHMLNGQSSRKHDNLQLLLPIETRMEISSRTGDYYCMLRSVVDFVSGLTDRHALSLYRRISGVPL